MVFLCSTSVVFEMTTISSGLTSLDHVNRSERQVVCCFGFAVQATTTLADPTRSNPHLFSNFEWRSHSLDCYRYSDHLMIFPGAVLSRVKINMVKIEMIDEKRLCDIFKNVLQFYAIEMTINELCFEMF